MSRAWLLLLPALLLPGSAYSDSSNLEGGVFITLHTPGLHKTDGRDWRARFWQESAIGCCSQQNTGIHVQGDNTLWYILAASDEAMESCKAESGFADYDTPVHPFEHGGSLSPAEDSEIPTAGRPKWNRSIPLPTSRTLSFGNLAHVCSFAGCACDASALPIALNPTSGFGETANCEMSPQSRGSDPALAWRVRSQSVLCARTPTAVRRSLDMLPHRPQQEAPAADRSPNDAHSNRIDIVAKRE
jgi:hypothetical protein